MTLSDFDSMLEAAWLQDFQGWDFSYLKGRWQEDPLSWNYESLVKTAKDNANALLDMGTGGGEFLASLLPLPKVTAATEAWKPNIPIARARLNPLGIKVYEVPEDGRLAMIADEEFDLVINRHEFYLPEEVYRIMKPNGLFISQQVGDKDARLLNDLLGIETEDYNAWNMTCAENDLLQADFSIEREEEEFPNLRFFDIGAVVYFLKVIEWQFPNFTPESHREALLEISKKIEMDGQLSVPQHRFLMMARK